jgi:pyridinium-3,5-bisthiocarboxylic acid mononucleotide nickel chelatase
VSGLHLHLDPLGGIAGDMFLAAGLDAFPEHLDGTVAAMRAAGLEAVVTLEPGTSRGLAGKRLRIALEGETAPVAAYPRLRALIAEAPLDPPVRERALFMLALLGEAEAWVHGVGIERVHFHELAGWDSLADLVGAAHLIEALGASWSVGPLPLGRGRVITEHGPLPVPAPATTVLLEGMALIDDGIGGERVTPTGAAILRHLGAGGGGPARPARLVRTGIGLGTRDLAGIANALRVLVLEDAEPLWATGRITLIAFEIDDQSGEDLALGLERLRASAGVVDVAQIPLVGKKGRLGAQVQVLCRPEAEEAAIEACFRETATIGLRIQRVARAELAREEARHEGLRVKRVRRPGGTTGKAESDDLDGGYALRRRMRRRAEGEG